MDPIPTPTTVGELSILVMTKLDSIEKQLDGLPSRVQALEYELAAVRQRSIDRRALLFTWLGMAATLAAGIAGVVIR